MGQPAIKDIYQLCSNRLPSSSPLQKLRIWRYPSIRILAGRSANHNQLSSEPLETMGTPSHHVAPHLVFSGSRFENRLLFYHCGSCQQQRVHSLLHARLRLDILQIFNAVVTFRKKPEGSTQFKHKTKHKTWKPTQNVSSRIAELSIDLFVGLLHFFHVPIIQLHFFESPNHFFQNIEMTLK